ncbi:MAG: signal peptidase I [Deltaproteobacteria bacterium]|nr:signal peptidase I [Deltaproteobacteria bacterium]
MANSQNTNAQPLTSTEQVEGKREFLKALVFCVVAVIVVRSFLFEPFKIPSSSMVPTLKIGDHIFVSKFSYGLFIPFTKFEIAAWKFPKRGDVIVFLFPRDESLHYVKRVIGIPGDRIEFKGRDLYINDQVVPREPVSDPIEVEQVTGTRSLKGALYKEILGDSVHYIVHSKGSVADYTQANMVETVPANKFFVVGDNRDDSYDSRSWGFVPRENIRGRAQVVWLSLNQEESWGKLNKVRWDRCGTLIY